MSSAAAENPGISAPKDVGFVFPATVPKTLRQFPALGWRNASALVPYLFFGYSSERNSAPRSGCASNERVFWYRLFGGRGRIMGTLVGVLIFGYLSNFLNLNNVPSDLQDILKGVIIVGAVLLQEGTLLRWIRRR